MSSTVTRRTFAARVGAVLSTLGIPGSVLIKGAAAQTSGGQNSAAQNSVAPDASGIRKTVSYTHLTLPTICSV